jgi:hypothetical protein
MRPFALMLSPLVLAFLAGRPPSPPTRDAVHATVALVADLPDPSARALIILRAGSGPDVVLLRQDQADVTDLAGALALLSRTRRDEGHAPVRDRHVVMKGARIDRSLSTGMRHRLENHLRRLRQTTERDVDGVGRVRAIEIQVSVGRSD